MEDQRSPRPYVFDSLNKRRSERDAAGNIQPNKNFPDMKALGDYIHSKGLKFGIYSSPGPRRALNGKAATVMSGKTPRATQPANLNLTRVISPA